MGTAIDPTSRRALAAGVAGQEADSGRRGGWRRLAAAAALALALLAGPPPSRAAQTGDLIGEMHDYYTWSLDEDMLDIARAEELGLIALMVANPGVDPWLPQRGLHLVLPTMHILPDAPRKGLVINTAELRLYYYDAEDGYLSFPLGVGRDGYLTPTGTTRIVRKKDHPSWTLTPSEVRDHPELPPVVPPGEDNPLGEYAMYLGWPSYLIHGTNTPWGIGRRTSRGCIRMYPEDIEWLFERVPVGTQVTVVNQPVKLGWKDDELYIEVEPSTAQVDTMEETSKAPAPPDPVPLASQADQILAKAGDAASRLDWPTIEKALTDRVGYPLRITLPQPAATAAAGSPTQQAANGGAEASSRAIPGAPAPAPAAAGVPAGAPTSVQQPARGAQSAPPSVTATAVPPSPTGTSAAPPLAAATKTAPPPAATGASPASPASAPRKP